MSWSYRSETLRQSKLNNLRRWSSAPNWGFGFGAPDGSTATHSESSGAQLHMSNDLTSTQQQPALGRYQRGDVCYQISCRSMGERLDGPGAFFGCASAPRLVNETKLALVAVMLELDRPVTSSEFRGLLLQRKPYSIFKYHLSTLVKARVAELVVDPDELRFRLNGSNQQGIEEFLASMPLPAYRLKRT